MRKQVSKSVNKMYIYIAHSVKINLDVYIIAQ